MSQFIKNFGILVCVLASMIACTDKTKKDAETKTEPVASAPSDTIPVKTLRIKPQTFSEYGRFIGQLSSLKEALLTSLAGGRVLKVNVSEGQSVKAGVPLCDIESEKYRLAKQAADLQAQVQEDQLSRSKIHLEQQSIAKSQLERSQLEAFTAERNQLEAEDIYRGAACISPIDGTVIHRHIDPFDQLAPGSPTLLVADTSQMKFTIGIPENMINGYKIGAQAILKSESFADQTITGAITSISGKVDQDSKTFRVEIQFPNPTGTLKTGMTGTAEVLRQEYASAIVIPVASLFNLTEGYAVFVVENGIAKRKQVTVASKTGEQALVTSGLVEGEELIIERSPSLTEETPVKVLETI